MPTLEPNTAVIPFNTSMKDTAATQDDKGGNYDAVRFNAMQHGILSRYTVLPHEDANEYQALLAALFDEHGPVGMTEAHLVEELASVIWRKRRVLQAEGANINKGLKGAAQDAKGVIPAAAPFELGMSGEGTDLRDLMPLTTEEVTENQRDALHDLESTREAKEILRRGSRTAYERALRALVQDSRDWWMQHVEEEEYPATAEGLADFIREQLEPLCLRIESGARHHEAIKSQALGEGLQAYRLEKLSRYETHLDRKFERILAMLLKLKELRVGRTA